VSGFQCLEPVLPWGPKVGSTGLGHQLHALGLKSKASKIGQHLPHLLPTQANGGQSSLRSGWPYSISTIKACAAPSVRGTDFADVFGTEREPGARKDLVCQPARPVWISRVQVLGLAVGNKHRVRWFDLLRHEGRRDATVSDSGKGNITTADELSIVSFRLLSCHLPVSRWVPPRKLVNTCGRSWS